ncbi:MAG: hypothetical protein Q8O99_05785 [bacterium]|nr:hypothetical protein [bacterium]
MFKKLRLTYSAFVQKEYPLRLKIKASLIGSLGILLLALQNSFLHNIDAIHHTSIIIGKLVTGIIASVVIGITALGSSNAASNGVFDP